MQKHEAVQLPTSKSAGGTFCFLSLHSPVFATVALLKFL